MNSSIKRNTALFCFIFFLFLENTQAQKNYNVFAIDAKFGMNIPITPNRDITISNYLLPRHLSLGVRYSLNENFGIKLHFARDRFQESTNRNIGNTYNRLAIEGTYNLTNHLRVFYNNEINILLHGGVGITQAYPEAIRRFRNGGEFTFGLSPDNTKDYERIGSIILGATPQYRFSDRIVFLVDLSLVISREQQYLYNGELIAIDRKKVIGVFTNFSIGLQYYIGKYRRHADWYNSERKY